MPCLFWLLAGTEDGSASEAQKHFSLNLITRAPGPHPSQGSGDVISSWNRFLSVKLGEQVCLALQGSRGGRGAGVRGVLLRTPQRAVPRPGALRPKL